MQGEARRGLEIRPSPVTLTGCDQPGPAFAFADGRFMGTPVYLGELRSDADGRLLFLGGRGVSAAYDRRPLYTFANNDG